MSDDIIQAQILRVNSHPSEIVPEDLEAARKLLAESRYPCIALVQRKLGIGYNYAAELFHAVKSAKA